MQTWNKAVVTGNPRKITSIMLGYDPSNILDILVRISAEVTSATPSLLNGVVAFWVIERSNAVRGQLPPSQFTGLDSLTDLNNLLESLLSNPPSF